MTAVREPSADTAALLTPVGRGAVATIRVEIDSGRLDKLLGTLFQAANGHALSEQPIGRIVFGKWGLASAVAEEIVGCRRGETSLEIHCHGGDAAVCRILGDLAEVGCRTVSWQQQVSDRDGLFEAECADRLSHATTWRTAEILQEQANGLLRDSICRLVDLVADMSAHQQAIAELSSLLGWARFGQHLSIPWNVVLTGRPNVGKSSLINALLGYERAIVFDQPGTTRDVVTAETAFDGWPVLLADTAGLRDTDEELEAAGIERARGQLKVADARLVLIDLSQPPSEADRELLASWPDAIVIAHKCDLKDCWGAETPEQAIRASSVSGIGLKEIQQRLVQQLVPCVPVAGTAIPICARQVELIRDAYEALQAGDRLTAAVLLQRIVQGGVTRTDA
jgi:tRNA modification GTPase